MRISGNGRKKTAGGVFIALLKEKVQAGTITLEDWSYIRAVSDTRGFKVCVFVPLIFRYTERSNDLVVLFVDGNFHNLLFK
jgi:hypothetical protein